MSQPRLLTDTPDWKALVAPDWPWLQTFRRNALDEFVRQGIPTGRVEEWKYTHVADFAEQTFVTAKSCHKDSLSVPVPTASPVATHYLVFRAGHYMPEESQQGILPSGAQLMPLQTALLEHNPLILAHLGQIAKHQGYPFAALNSSWMNDGLLLYLPAGCQLTEGIHCRFYGPQGAETEACYPRLLVILEPDAELLLIEEFVGSSADNPHLTDTLAEIRLASNARMSHYKLLNETAIARHIAGTHVEQAAGSHYHAFSLALNCGLARNDLNVRLQGEGATVRLEGLYLLSGQQHLDNHLHVDHLQPGANSEVFYKGILSGHSHGVFNGRAVVHPDAQRSSARQVNKNLLLSQGAEMDTKPELQIEADDVQCSHGATVGHLDKEAMFYLRSRGLDPDDARALLTFAFAKETLNHLPTKPLKTWFQAHLVNTLNCQLGGQMIQEVQP